MFVINRKYIGIKSGHTRKTTRRLITIVKIKTTKYVYKEICSVRLIRYAEKYFHSDCTKQSFYL